MTDTKTEMTASEYAEYYQWAHEFTASMSSDKEIEANRLAGGIIELVEFRVAEARREALREAKAIVRKAVMLDENMAFSFSALLEEIDGAMEAIEQLAEDKHE